MNWILTLHLFRTSPETAAYSSRPHEKLSVDLSRRRNLPRVRNSWRKSSGSTPRRPRERSLPSGANLVLERNCLTRRLWPSRRRSARHKQRFCPHWGCYSLARNITKHSFSPVRPSFWFKVETGVVPRPAAGCGLGTVKSGGGGAGACYPDELALQADQHDACITGV